MARAGGVRAYVFDVFHGRLADGVLPQDMVLAELVEVARLVHAEHDVVDAHPEALQREPARRHDALQGAGECRQEESVPHPPGGQEGVGDNGGERGRTHPLEPQEERTGADERRRRGDARHG